MQPAILCAALLWTASGALSAAPPYLIPAEGASEPDGSAAGRQGGNVIYYLFLPGAQKAFGPARLKLIVAAGNTMLTSLGVKTRMAGLMLGKDYDPALLDPRDKLAVLGDKAEVLETLLRVDPGSGYVANDWQPEANNPETSDRHGGKWTAVDVGAVKRYSADMGGKARPELVAAMFAVHGVGHQVGIGHPEEGNFMDDGSRVAAYISGKSEVYIDENRVLVRVDKHRPLMDLFKAEDFAKMGIPSPRLRTKKDTTTQLARWKNRFGDEQPVMGYAFKVGKKAPKP